MEEYKVVSVTTIPTGYKSKSKKGGIYIKILNKYIEIDIKNNVLFPNFKFFNVTILNRKSKTFNYFMDLYVKKTKIKEMIGHNLLSWKGGKFTSGYEGTICGISVIGFDGDEVKLHCDRFESV